MSGGDNKLRPFDVKTMDDFDNAYYQNLVSHHGLQHSHQNLFNGGSKDMLVRQYNNTPTKF
jgi:hypothetical protein